MPNSASDARNSERDIRETLIRKGLISQMVSMSSNMFSTVTLPASLWFFDKSNEIADFETQKEQIKILFIDARNVYRQIDRAHREFTQEQIWNLGVITNLYKNKEEKFTDLVDKYIETTKENLPSCLKSYQDFKTEFNTFKKAFNTWFTNAKLNKEQQEKVKKEKLKETVLEVKDFDKDSSYTTTFKAAQKALEVYSKSIANNNQTQNEVTTVLTAFEEQKKATKKTFEKTFRALEKGYKFADKELKNKDDKNWKAIPNLKDLRNKLDAFIEHTNPQINAEPVYTDETEGKSAIYFLKQLQWLQERFPEGKYEDVIGLCKVANYAEIEEQDFSLNSGRYVGVVIEEDGMTEEEFSEEMVRLNKELNKENKASKKILETINLNLTKLTDTYEV